VPVTDTTTQEVWLASQDGDGVMEPHADEDYDQEGTQLLVMRKPSTEEAESALPMAAGGFPTSLSSKDAAAIATRTTAMERGEQAG
jgi:hypothetical protein